MSKDPSMLGAPTHERHPDDFYPTPSWCTEVLLRHWRPRGVVWEPAAGDGAIVDVIREYFYPTWATDLHQRRSDIQGGVDFFAAIPPVTEFSIVTNPPNNLAEEFLREALKLTSNVAMLFRHEFDCAASRADLYRLPNFVGKIVLTKRPRWIADSTGSPRHNWAWSIWDQDRTPRWAWDQ